MAEFNGMALSRPNKVASGTWNLYSEWGYNFIYPGWPNPWQTDYPAVIEIDTGYDDYATVFDVNSPSFTANAIVTGAYYWASSSIGSAKAYDLQASCIVKRQLAHYSTGASGTVPLGRIVLSIVVPLPPVASINSLIWQIRVDQIKWALMRVT